MVSERRRLIVDGYNVLHARPEYAALAAEDLDSARARLVADLAGIAQDGPRVVVVFDGGDNPASDGQPHQVGRLTVVFSPAGSTADAVVESLAARSRSRGEEAVVVTSDNATREAVRAGSISVLSAGNFLEDLASAAAEWSMARRSGATRVPMGRRIDPTVQERLARWARGDGSGGMGAR
ncbi:MAG: NYN domain-containing protein [Aeromicrobium sp.]|nr:NYN domain-containing protein [Aeromicrobium sp.]